MANDSEDNSPGHSKSRAMPLVLRGKYDGTTAAEAFAPLFGLTPERMEELITAGHYVVDDRRWHRAEVRRGNRPRCEARTRSGGTCKAAGLGCGGRCRLHGGMSTGPRTAEGRKRCREAVLRRWRNSPSPSVPAHPKSSQADGHRRRREVKLLAEA